MVLVESPLSRATAIMGLVPIQLRSVMSTLVVALGSMRTALSWLLYHLGDLVSLTSLRYGYGYRLYNKLMCWSVKLDVDYAVWKSIK